MGRKASSESDSGKITLEPCQEEAIDSVETSKNYQRQAVVGTDYRVTVKTEEEMGL